MSIRKLEIFAGLLLLGLTLAPGVFAIIIRHDRPDAAYRELAAEYPVCSLQLDGWACGCTLIDPQWALTAAHAVGAVEPGHRIEVDGVEAVVAEVIPYPSYESPGDRGDLALLRLEKPVEGPKPIPLYKGHEEEGQRMIFVGRGLSGTGETGAKTEDRVLRAAENRVEETTEAWLLFVFDPPASALELEGISGPGDSGGPAFLKTEEGLFLVGVSAFQDNSEQGEVEGVYGVKEYYSRISSFADWIEQVMTEHGAAGKPDAP